MQRKHLSAAIHPTITQEKNVDYTSSTSHINKASATGLKPSAKTDVVKKNQGKATRASTERSQEARQRHIGVNEDL